ncbi:tyrosine-type recombinase/integrase [Clostridium bowmanii]|uniref:tyrosine-type recombinase/integrase n=1 Tax=Clostridium bowmanii TaxID=132925 RepID=UPI001C0CAD34|nr:tyrosine-type recombinase/integrase [Clostridium bowmanii]MBU3191926.1 tyrosine-type recombinase/integrase [Clostridium bowmanii]MCA1074518.1 tyrosine-type recombinase/integrase [Clostridium bowmanii]
MNKFTSFLAPLIQSYIYYQKSSQHWNEASYEPNLVLFDRYCKKQYPKVTLLSQEIVDSWCHKRYTETNNSCRSRIYVVVSLIRYLRKRGNADVVEPNIPRKERCTYIPHSFTNTELERFFHACDSLPSEFYTPEQRSRKITIPVFFRLLYSSGVRTNEARMLRIEDVDLCQGIINIRYSKGHSQHYVVLHDSMLNLLKIYDASIRKQYPHSPYFFPARCNTFHTRNWVQKNFRELWDKYNSSHATAYELRHHYATENINRWTGEGFGFDAKLLYLSKSMGHKVLESTKYYYSLVPGLADILEEKTGMDFEIIVPEVDYDESDE